ncbi:MAG: PHP domain-containing protein [Anaerolineales bacterium]|nr:MAG: PHP domain-containing protein [Anaerolineales bacterium]
MIIDMHVHTEKYSGCAHMSPQVMAKTAIERGMDGVVITEHDYLWSEIETQTLQAQFPELKILRGIEVSTAEGHALAYGISTENTAYFYPNVPLSELTRIVHDVGGIVILAHPARYEDEIPNEVYTAGIDGVELMSMNVRKYMEQAIETIQSQLKLPGIAGTDAHVTDSLGIYGTNFQVAIDSEQELVAAIKAHAYSLYGNLDRIQAYNRTVKNKVNQMEKLLQEGVMSNVEIKESYGFNDSFQKGVRRGKDMHLRMP